MPPFSRRIARPQTCGLKPAGQERGRGRLAGRTQGGLNTRLHAVGDAKGCRCRGTTDPVLPERRSGERPQRRSGAPGEPGPGPTGSWPTKAARQTGSARPPRTRASSLAAPAGAVAANRSNTTSAPPSGATASRPCPDPRKDRQRESQAPRSPPHGAPLSHRTRRNRQAPARRPERRHDNSLARLRAGRGAIYGPDRPPSMECRLHPQWTKVVVRPRGG